MKFEEVHYQEPVPEMESFEKVDDFLENEEGVLATLRKKTKKR